jgi:hypothetical protein
MSSSTPLETVAIASITIWGPGIIPKPSFPSCSSTRAVQAKAAGGKLIGPHARGSAAPYSPQHVHTAPRVTPPRRDDAHSHKHKHDEHGNMVAAPEQEEEVAAPEQEEEGGATPLIKKLAPKWKRDRDWKVKFERTRCALLRPSAVLRRGYGS